jgi:serine/threonine protein kinase
MDSAESHDGAEASAPAPSGSYEGPPPSGSDESEPPPPELDDPLVGTTVDGRYIIESVLGQGGMGMVYKARHSILSKPLAIKVLLPEVSRNAEIIARFRQEAQSASAIGNHHIIDISDFGVLPDKSTYFVMEFLDGRDLTHAIENEQPIPASVVVHVGKQLCDALGAAHEAGIVHRDLKPDNIFLVKRGDDRDFVKVLDFGIAKVGGASSKLTRAGQVFGTPHYMSPEQCSGSGVDHRTDIYALGVILYETICGRVPFDADNLMGILTKHLYEVPPPPHTLPPPVDCPPGLEAVILKCLTKQAELRYQTMREVKADLEKVEAGLTPEAVLDAVERQAADAPRDPTGRLVTSSVTGSTTGSGLHVAVGSESLGEEPPNRLPMLLGILAAVLLLVGGGGLAAWFTVLQPRISPPPRAAAPTRAPAEVPVEAPPEVPEPPPELPETPAVPAEVHVTVRSNPDGAEVSRDDEILGNTPLEIVRPEGDDRITLTVRAAAHEPREVVLTSLTTEEITITLDAVRRAASRRPRRPRRPQARSGSTARPSAQPERPRPVSRSEVLNPWAE